MPVAEIVEIVLLVVLAVGLVLLIQGYRRLQEARAAVESDRQRILAEARDQAVVDAKTVRAEADLYASDVAALVDTRLAEAQHAREAAERDRAEAKSRREAELRRFHDQMERESDELRERLQAAQRREQRLAEREDRLDAESRALDTRMAALATAHTQVEAEQQAAAELVARRTAELERAAGMTGAEAAAELLRATEHDARLQAAAITRDIEAEAKRRGDEMARRIVVTAIQRIAAEETAASVVSTVELTGGDDMKGRIIGREGRNIRAFEQITGANVLIDDTPGSVTVSCFDPVRREIARLTLSELIADGRIHPARIEEVHERAQREIEQRCQRAGEDAVAEVGITDLHPVLVTTLGRLHYRTSYGQNVLRHLVECGHLAAMMAAELGLDVDQCRRAAFLHDIGKALTHEVEGTHAMVGAELARRHGENADVVHAIEAHHNEVEPRTVEALITQACDAISGGRPGARRESMEAYIKRLERLEEIAAAHEGVDKVFAMQAGRELRVMVEPQAVDDLAAHALARDIAAQIQDELTYPGQIRVTVVRESRATQIAH